ncbi:MAG: hypothetical protein GC155_10220 [Alphaproteobacteria bacterium]|nr:hypothetical protein [Alphaproteobacteria bacterium]
MKIAFGLASGVLVLVSATGSVIAQEFTAPRFEGLEQQQQIQQQNNLDAAQKRLQDERLRTLQPGPAGQPPGANAAASALRQSEIQDEIYRQQLRAEQDRQHVARENAITDTALPNRRIAKSSVLVVTDPVHYGLPSAPPGQYYARLNGRFVLVDSTSELVVKVLDPRPTDPTGDGPTRPLPRPQPPIPVAPPGSDTDP